jgi:MFS family permease
MSASAALDWLNFLLADVRGGLGPYVSVFLVTEAKWDQATIGLVLTISGLTGIALHTPIGIFIDASSAKRGLLIAGVLALSACALAIAFKPILPVVLAADIAMAILGAVFAPTVAAITLGLVKPDRLAARLGRNAAFDRAGNLFVAAAAAAAGSAFGLRAVFYLVPLFACAAIVAVLAVPGNAIDHERARGSTPHQAPIGWLALITRKPLLILAAVAALFGFANTAMLTLISQKLALSHPGREAALTSAAIVVAQLVMIPMALLVTRADTIGHKRLLLMAITALILRGVLFTVSDNAAWLVSVQALDGVGTGLFEALLPLVLADIMRGTGRYNVSRGFIGTIQGIGGSLSQGAGGLAVVYAGYDAAFLILASVALIPLILVVVAMPDIRSAKPEGSPSD